MITLFDAKAAAYNVPQFVQSIGGAIRSFSDEINRQDPNNVLFNHPSDFLLFEMGSYDDSDATIETLDTMRLIASGADLRNT